MNTEEYVLENFICIVCYTNYVCFYGVHKKFAILTIIFSIRYEST